MKHLIGNVGCVTNAIESKLEQEIPDAYKLRVVEDKAEVLDVLIGSTKVCTYSVKYNKGNVCIDIVEIENRDDLLEILGRFTDKSDEELLNLRFNCVLDEIHKYTSLVF